MIKAATMTTDILRAFRFAFRNKWLLTWPLYWLYSDDIELSSGSETQNTIAFFIYLLSGSS